MSARFFAFITLTVAMVWLASVRPVIVDVTYSGFRFKLTHIGAFAVHFALTWALLKPHLKAAGKTLFAAILVSTAVGALIEVLQAYLPHRRGQASDMIQNFIGIALGIVTVFTWSGIAALWRRRFGKA